MRALARKALRACRSPASLGRESSSAVIDLVLDKNGNASISIECVMNDFVRPQ
ncbi:hypothetical protein BURMUCGD1_2024 [Burkholderia multivorans CGD1]|nr:hypothetical protein BURMUCGD1_2024 [Burkholderia multivorans CGD1]